MQQDLMTAITDIGLALNASHGLTVTDLPIKENQFWQLDHSQELQQLSKLTKHLNKELNNGTCHECSDCKTSP